MLLFLLLLLILLVLLLLFLLLLHLHGFHEVIARLVVFGSDTQRLFVRLNGFVELTLREIGVAQIVVVVSSFLMVFFGINEFACLLKRLGSFLIFAVLEVSATYIVVSRNRLVVLLQRAFVVQLGIHVVGIHVLAVAFADIRRFFLCECRRGKYQQYGHSGRSAENVPTGQNFVLAREDKELNHEQQQCQNGKRLILLVVVGECGGFDLLLSQFVQLLLQRTIGGVGVVAADIESFACLCDLAAHVFIQVGNDNVSLSVLAELSCSGNRNRTAFGFAYTDHVYVNAQFGSFLCSFCCTFLVVLTIGDQNDGSRSFTFLAAESADRSVDSRADSRSLRLDERGSNMLQEHLGGYIISRDRQLGVCLSCKHNQADFVVRHVVNQFAEHLFGSVQTRRSDIFGKHGVGYIQCNHHFDTLAFFHAFRLSVLRSCRSNNQTSQGKHQYTELDVYAACCSIRHERVNQCLLAELACRTTFLATQEDVSYRHSRDEQQQPQEFYISKSKHKVIYDLVIYHFVI